MRVEHRLQHVRVVEVQVGLVAEEAVPVVGLRDRVPGPVGGLGVGEDDARARVLLVGVAPHVVVALGRAGRRAARGLEPRVLVGGVVDDELGDHLAGRAGAPRAATRGSRRACRSADARCGSRRCRSRRPQRRRIERQQPDRVDAELLDVVELRGQAPEVADAVVVGVEEGLDVQLVDDRVFVPERVVGAGAVTACCAATISEYEDSVHAQSLLTRSSRSRARCARARRRRKTCAGTLCGSSRTKLRAPCHRKRASVSRSCIW